MKLYGAILKTRVGDRIALEEEPIAARSLQQAKRVATHFHASSTCVVIDVVQIKHPRELTCYFPGYEDEELYCWYDDNDPVLNLIGDVPVWGIFFWKEYKKINDKYSKEYASKDDEDEEGIEKSIDDHLDAEAALKELFNSLPLIEGKTNGANP